MARSTRIPFRYSVKVFPVSLWNKWLKYELFAPISNAASLKPIDHDSAPSYNKSLYSSAQNSSLAHSVKSPAEHSGNIRIRRNLLPATGPPKASVPFPEMTAAPDTRNKGRLFHWPVGWSDQFPYKYFESAPWSRLPSPQMVQKTLQQSVPVFVYPVCSLLSFSDIRVQCIFTGMACHSSFWLNIWAIHP